MRKTITAVFLCMLVVIAFGGCASDNVSESEIMANVKITDAQQKVILDASCSFAESNATAADALVSACRDNKISYQNKNGLYDDFNGIASTQEEGWLFYFNGELAEKGAQETLLDKDGENLVEMRYVNFADAFSQN